MRVFSIVGLIPLCATASVTPGELADLPELEEPGSRGSWTTSRSTRRVVGEHRTDDDGGDLRRLLSLVTPEQLARILARMLDDRRSSSARTACGRCPAYTSRTRSSIDLGGQQFSVDYEPAESRTATFGGNSNWRGPIWMPSNFLIIGALREFDAYLGDEVKVEYPTGSGRKLTLGEVADDLSARLITAFLPGPDGRRPIYGDYELLATHPDWRDRIIFPEYFHGDTGAALGASHQTGWTALVAALILSRDGHHPPRIR